MPTSLRAAMLLEMYGDSIIDVPFLPNEPGPILSAVCEAATGEARLKESLLYASRVGMG